MATRDGALAVSADHGTADDGADWKRAHTALSRIARKRAELDAEEGRRLLRALRSAAHVHLGFASFAEYIERLFGYRPRTTQEKLRVAEALEGLPLIARALETGSLGWCAARELTRVAVAETESAWLDTARGKTLRGLEALVADRSPGDAPDAPRTERPRMHLLRFQVTPETFATFREAMLRMRRQSGISLNDDALLLAMARHVLGGSHDEGRASYQISLQVCSACGAGAQSAAGELVPVDAAVVDMALCDGQNLGELLPSVSRSPDSQPSVVLPAAAARQAANENARSSACSARQAHVPAQPNGNPLSGEQVAAASSIDRSEVGAAELGSDALAESNRDMRSPLECPDRAHAGVENEPSSPSNAPDVPRESSHRVHEDAGTLRAGDPASTFSATTVSPDHAISDVENRAPSDVTPAPHATSGGAAPPRHAVATTARPSRAQQTIPPALRRAVLARDRHRCTVPGCTHATFDLLSGR